MKSASQTGRIFAPYWLSLWLIIALAGCSAVPVTSPKQSEVHAAQVTESFNGRFKAVKCQENDLKQDVDCGYLVVPADHNNPAGEKMRLPVTILRARVKQKAADPVVYLTGEPNSTLTKDWTFWSQQIFLQKRDLILLDLRGFGNAEPSLECPELGDSQYPDKQAAAQACRLRLVGRGIDLSLFTSEQSAADINMLRQALGIEQWNIVGVSYGARLALLMMRDYPDTIRSVVLDSVYPPGMNAYETRPANGSLALSRLFEACQNDPGCAMAYPDLDKVTDEIILSLDEKPVQLTVLNPQSGERTAIYLDGYSFSDLLFQALHHHETLARIPYAIYQLHYGKFEAIAGLMFPTSTSMYDPVVLQQTSNQSIPSQGAYFARECAEEVAYNTLKNAESQAEQAGSVFADHLMGNITQMFNICQVWAPQATPLPRQEVFTSRIPTLILSGAFDPITPVGWSEAAAENLPNSYFFVFPGLGHHVLEEDKCPRLMMADFLVDPTTRTADTCREKMTITFWTP